MGWTCTCLVRVMQDFGYPVRGLWTRKGASSYFVILSKWGKPVIVLFGHCHWILMKKVNTSPILGMDLYVSRTSAAGY